tara:strand:- start:21 stop:281 length:261 start_codon:yes stop_codon:yes gene_type:complete
MSNKQNDEIMDAIEDEVDEFWFLYDRLDLRADLCQDIYKGIYGEIPTATVLKDYVRDKTLLFLQKKCSNSMSENDYVKMGRQHGYI